jgi:hypothetical protein
MDSKTVANAKYSEQPHRATLLPSKLAQEVRSPQICSDIHQIVHAFRAAHNHDSLPVRIERYPIDAAPETERSSIQQLSRIETYASLRRGLRLLPLYPPLNDDALTLACKEIRAALVWNCG